MKLNREDISTEIEAHKENLKHHLRAAEILKIAIKAFENELEKYPKPKQKAE